MGRSGGEFQLEINAKHISTLLKQIMRRQLLDARGIFTNITARY